MLIKIWFFCILDISFQVVKHPDFPFKALKSLTSGLFGIKSICTVLNLMMPFLSKAPLDPQKFPFSFIQYFLSLHILKNTPQEGLDLHRKVLNLT